MTEALLQVEECEMMFGVPSAKPNQFCRALKLCEVIATECSPCFSTISFTRLAMSFRASSQETSTNFPSPRSPVRFMGFLRRIGEFQTYIALEPRAQ